MFEFYHIGNNATARSIIEIKANAPYKYADIFPYLMSTSNQKLPVDVTFSVIKGKRWTDIIVLNGDISICFYSHRLIHLLSKFVDNMFNMCYPISIEGTDQVYYVIYNLEKMDYWEENFQSDDVPPCFIMRKDMPSLFTLPDSNLKICSHTLKEVLCSNKLSNIEFWSINGYAQCQG